LTGSLAGTAALSVAVLSFSLLVLLSIYAFHRLWILYLYYRYYKLAVPRPSPAPPSEWPLVTVQLPIFNERYVVERLLEAVCLIDYPADRLEIQILDDSTDDTTALARRLVRRHRAAGRNVRLLHRDDRRGFKAGALQGGLESSQAEFVAVFDADFLPPPDFLKRTIPHFADRRLGLVQARWGHVNAGYSLLTRLQSLFLDGHFMLEHTARNRSGAFFNFNGTAGIWRRLAIETSGGWSADTLTEDLDLSYRAQMGGWRFLFLPDLVCPAELPVDMPGFRNQQHRWTKGAFQVAQKVLPALWRSSVPLRIKIEATAHLTANVGYCLLVLYTLLALPALWARRTLGWPPVLTGAEVSLLGASLASLTLFYLVAHREASPDHRVSLREVPLLMAFGVGMAVNNARAVLEAILGIPTDFRRTAKFNITGRGDPWRGSRYRTTLGGRGLLEASLALYLALPLSLCLMSGRWATALFVFLLLAGHLAVGGLTLAHTLKARE